MRWGWRAEGTEGIGSGTSWAVRQAIISAVFLSIAAACGAYGYDRYATSEARRRAESDISRIRDELYVLRPPEAGHFLLQAYGVKGPAALPAPFSSVSVPEGAEIRAFMYLRRRRGTVVILSLARGEVHYLWSDFYGNRRMQRIEL